MSHLLQLNTDQTKCYNEAGENIPCAGSGQDGETHHGQSVPAARFEVSGAVATDRATELCWSQNASPATFPMSWFEAFEYVAQLNRSRYQGIADWRLPSRRELFSLIGHQYMNPALPYGHLFTEVFAGYYWSATTSVYEKRYAWVFYPRDGDVGVGYKPLPEFCAWAVRYDRPQSIID